ncbi:acyltransferase domain-containing protein [Buchnera aphidicola]|uniref:acyltransferase domain-containing protein n=1 Tax=Buchnera aphidicola TaxID=9 RepID=UPI0030EC3628
MIKINKLTKKKKKKISIIFSGQGNYSFSKIIKISKKYLEVVKIFKKSSKILKKNIWKIIYKKKKKFLQKNQYFQVINLITNLALYKIWKKYYKKKKYFYSFIFSGHSLGQYSALVASKSIKFADALKIVFFRGKLLKKKKGFMIVIFNEKKIKIKNLLNTNILKKLVSISNINSKKQIVIAGSKKIKKKIIFLLKKKNIKKFFQLPIKHPFHCISMKKFAKNFFNFINKFSFYKPKHFYIDSNLVNFLTNPKEIKKKLAKQIYTPVLWEKTIQFILTQNIDEILEIGLYPILSKFDKNKKIKFFKKIFNSFKI